MKRKHEVPSLYFSLLQLNYQKVSQDLFLIPYIKVLYISTIKYALHAFLSIHALPLLKTNSTSLTPTSHQTE